MTQVPFRLSGCLWWLAVFWLAMLPAETLHLSYNPDDGALFEVTERFQRVTSFTDREPVTDVRERRSRVRIRRTNEGFANIATILSLTLTRNARNVASPVFAAMQELELTYHLTGTGQLIRISGYEQLPTALRAKAPGPMAETMLSMLNYNSLRRQDETAYREIYRELPGSSFELGEVRPAARGHALPYGGSTPLYAVEVFTGDASGDGRVRLERRFHSRPEALAMEFDGIDPADLIDAAGWLEPAVPENHASVSVEGAEETMFDPASMLISSQRSTLDYELSLKRSEGDPVSFRIRDSRQFTVEAIEQGAE